MQRPHRELLNANAYFAGLRTQMIVGWITEIIKSYKHAGVMTAKVNGMKFIVSLVSK